MAKAVISTIGHDRPGLVSDITAIATDLALNIEDSRMTVLGGEFAVLMAVEGSEATLAQFDEKLSALCSGNDLAYIYRPTRERSTNVAVRPYTATVVALDHPGIVHAIAAFFSARGINIRDDSVEVEVSPTYSGCPATEVIEDSIASKLRDEGVGDVSVRRVLSPPWTTDWISDAGREKLREYGIAPPVGSAGKRQLLGKGAVRCPRCGTGQTSVVSEFGSTACKAAYKCDECLEPFEYFKCI